MQRNRILNSTALGLLLALVVAGPVHAVDGVIEINQTRAKAGGVTPGDTPLFPVTIDQPGSYRLTGNLDVTDASARPVGTLAENTTAIEITAFGVTVDLNGFVIKGPTTCPGTPPMCSPVGSGNGVSTVGDVNEVEVKNGTVFGMGGVAVSLAGISHVENIRAASNGQGGIFAGLATNCTAYLNGGAGGIFVLAATGCRASSNAGVGIAATTATGCTATGNSGTGIVAVTATGCTATDNSGKGIAATTATGCTAFNNTPNLTADGIAAHNICGPPNAPCP